MQCFSECTKLTLPFHALGADDLGQIRCMECGSFFTKKAIQKTLEARFGVSWPAKYKELLRFKTKIGRINRTSRREGFNMVERTYFIDPPAYPELHQNQLTQNTHSTTNQDNSDEGTKEQGPRVYHLTDYDSHE